MASDYFFFKSGSDHFQDLVPLLMQRNKKIKGKTFFDTLIPDIL